ncbi:hypothetical protein H0R92_04095 [Treponema sp. OMZ 840]|uniref:hypothetical protein n=1 Tax=Treponema sp. OMZ 840 TaxID=244313 RepID=UPI003D93870D
MKKRSLTGAFGLCVAVFLFAQKPVDLQKVNFITADKQSGKTLLIAEDDFTRNLSAFDLSARLKTSQPVTKEAYLEFIGEQTLDWTTDERKKMQTVFADIKKALSAYSLSFPETVYVVKTTGLEEGGSAYCRSINIIVLPESVVADSEKELRDTCLHELFHIYSRNNPEKRERLYNILGFYKTGDLIIPEKLYGFKITNPDSVANNYYFNARIENRTIPVMPLLFAAEQYDENKGGEFFEYMLLLFFAVNAESDASSLLTENNKYKVFSINQISNYYELIGENTDYIIHAEEVLADNFVLAANGETDVKTPELLEKIKIELKK